MLSSDHTRNILKDNAKNRIEKQNNSTDGEKIVLVNRKCIGTVINNCRLTCNIPKKDLDTINIFDWNCCRNCKKVSTWSCSQCISLLIDHEKQCNKSEKKTLVKKSKK